LKCAVCDNEAFKQAYCELHAKAYENITRKYRHWKKAMNISWKEYLSQIAENPLTGECAKQVAQHLITIEEK
jgi:hypothetical protein